MKRKKKPNLYITSDACGNYELHDTYTGSSIRFSTSTMSVDDIRTLLCGIGDIFKSISAHLWDKEFKTKIKTRRKS